MSYSPNFNDDDTLINRNMILKQMLEHETPAFVFSCILDKIELDVFKECIDDVKKFGYISEFIFESMYGDKQKIANSTGKDSLKKLVGKIGKDSNLSDKDWQNVGRQISDMSGYNKRDYIGMMNFLNTSCYMYSFISNRLGRSLRDKVKRKYDVRKENPINRIKKQDSPEKVINTSKPNTSELEQKKKVRKKQLQLNDNIIYQFDEFNKINENIKKLDAVNELELNDIITLVAYSLSQLSDLQVSEIYDEIYDYDEDDYKGDDEGKIKLPYMNLYDEDGNILTEKWNDPSVLSGIRNTRGNGKGGLKSLVGKTTGDELEESDLAQIASKIKSMPEDEASKYMGYVSFLGSSCPIFSNIRKGYLSGIKDKTTTRFGKRQKRHNYKK